MLLKLKYATCRSTHRLAFSLNWHKSVVEQGTFNNVHSSLCWTVSSSALHRQVVFAVGVAKPHFFSSVFVLVTPVRKRLRHRHVIHHEFDPGDSFSYSSFGLERPLTFADITVSADLEKGLLDPSETSE